MTPDFNATAARSGWRAATQTAGVTSATVSGGCSRLHMTPACSVRLDPCPQCRISILLLSSGKYPWCPTLLKLVCFMLRTRCVWPSVFAANRVVLHAGNELQMMLRRMVPSHPQADARKLAQRTQQSSQEQQQSQHFQQQPQDQMQSTPEDHVLPEHAALSVGTKSGAQAEETVGAAMDADEGELPLEDEEYSPDGVATAAPAQQPQHQPATVEPPVRPTSDVSTTTDAAVPPSSAQPSIAAAAAFPSPTQPSGASHAVADGGHAAADDGEAEVAARSEDTAKSRDGNGNGNGESAQSQPPPAGRGELPELEEEVAATAMQVSSGGGLLCLHTRQLDEVMRCIGGVVLLVFGPL